MTPELLNANPTPLAKLLGIAVTAAGPDGVTAEMVVRGDLCTMGGICHGGALMSLADNTGAIATFINLPEGASGTTTIESKTNLVGAAKAGSTVVARATPVHVGGTTQVWQTRIETVEGRLVCLTTQTQMVLRR